MIVFRLLRSLCRFPSLTTVSFSPPSASFVSATRIIRIVITVISKVFGKNNLCPSFVLIILSIGWCVFGSVLGVSLPKIEWRYIYRIFFFLLVMERNWYRTMLKIALGLVDDMINLEAEASMFNMDLMAETSGVWYYIFPVEIKEEDDTPQFECYKFNDPNKQRSVSPSPQMPLPDVLKEARSERKRFSTPHPRRMESEKGMKAKLSHKNSFKKRSFNLRSPSGPIRDLGTLRIQERVKSKKDTEWSMRRWPDVKSSNWPFTFLDWVLVSLGTQVLSRDVTHVFKTSIWKIRQRRLPDAHSESMPKSSIILISTKRQDTSLFSTTSISHFKSKVMPKAFWSLSYKLLANIKYVKEGHN